MKKIITNFVGNEIKKKRTERRRRNGNIRDGKISKDGNPVKI